MFDILKKSKKTKEKVEDIATEAMVEAIPVITKPTNPWPRPLHYPTCECHKCVRWRAAENA